MQRQLEGQLKSTRNEILMSKPVRLRFKALQTSEGQCPRKRDEANTALAAPKQPAVEELASHDGAKKGCGFR